MREVVGRITLHVCQNPVGIFQKHMWCFLYNINSLRRNLRSLFPRLNSVGVDEEAQCSLGTRTVVSMSMETTTGQKGNHLIETKDTMNYF